MKRFILWSIGAIAILLVLVAIFGVLYIWHLNRLLYDFNWTSQAKPEEIKVVSQRILLFPVGNHHDAFIFLIDYGDVDSVPYLLRGLAWEADTPEHGVMIDTKMCCLDALRRITGHDAGCNYAEWQKWWDEEGSRLPASAFPLNDGTYVPRPKPAPAASEE